MRSYNLQQIIDCLSDPWEIKGLTHEVSVTNVNTPAAADSDSLIWIKPANNTMKLAETTKARVIICNGDLLITDALLMKRCFIIVHDPKLSFIRVATRLFGGKKEAGIHPSAIIDVRARIGKNVSIGPNTIIEDAEIGDGTVISGNCSIVGRVKIGKNVFINSGVVIGSEGFGYSRNSEGVLEKFPHFGGVVIEDNAEIGANTCIDRGTLGNTLICEGAKIDNLVHIAHNVVVGRNSLVIANAMVGGSTVIGDESWIAPSASLMNGIKIGNNVTVGMAALVTKSIPDGETWAGFPACPIKQYISIQKKIKEL
ncbi:MAG: UDP-3-O-(3-hydroxymyristoyl)glucosamine N-acyltransferase [Bacteroidota bacterium]